MLDEIKITKTAIFEEHPKMDSLFKSALESAFSGNSSGVEVLNIDARDLISENGDNNLKPLAKCKGKTGVYIFLGGDCLPKYIGKGGTSKRSNSKTKDLHYRISQELRPYTKNNQNTLSKNIIELESVLGSKKISPANSIEIIKNCKIRVLILGERMRNSIVNFRLIEKVEALEMILIALLPSKYNK